MSPVYRIGVSLFRQFGKGFLHFDVKGRDHLIEEGGCLIAANHVSYMDPPIVGMAFQHEVNFLARKTLFRGFGSWIYPRWNAIPVDQENPEVKTLKTVIRLLKDGERVVVFPEGKRSEHGELNPGQPGVGLMVAKSKVPVLPARIFGAYEALPRGAKMIKQSHVTVVFGEPLYFDSEEYAKGGAETYQRISDEIMEAIGSLKV